MLPSEPENQSNLKKNALWKHWLFLIDFEARGHSFSNSQTTPPKTGQDFPSFSHYAESFGG
jgi:hypothetical protein